MSLEKKLSDFYDFVKEIGFVKYHYPADHVTAFEYEDWVIYISFGNENMKWGPRWSISYFHRTLSIENNIRNFAIDDTMLLENLFKDVIRDKKLDILFDEQRVNELGI